MIDSRLAVFLILLCSISSACCGWLVCYSRTSFPRWKAGFDNGYELARKHFDRSNP